MRRGSADTKKISRAFIALALARAEAEARAQAEAADREVVKESHRDTP